MYIQFINYRRYFGGCIYCQKQCWYDKIGVKIYDIQVNEYGQVLYSNLIYIVENKNGDIVIVDFLKYKVVLVDKLGEY